MFSDIVSALQSLSSGGWATCTLATAGISLCLNMVNTNTGTTGEPQNHSCSPSDVCVTCSGTNGAASPSPTRLPNPNLIPTQTPIQPLPPLQPPPLLLPQLPLPLPHPPRLPAAEGDRPALPMTSALRLLRGPRRKLESKSDCLASCVSIIGNKGLGPML